MVMFWIRSKNCTYFHSFSIGNSINVDHPTLLFMQIQSLEPINLAKAPCQDIYCRNIFQDLLFVQNPQFLVPVLQFQFRSYSSSFGPTVLVPVPLFQFRAPSSSSGPIVLVQSPQFQFRSHCSSSEPTVLVPGLQFQFRSQLFQFWSHSSSFQSYFSSSYPIDLVPVPLFQFRPSFLVPVPQLQFRSNISCSIPTVKVPVPHFKIQFFSSSFGSPHLQPDPNVIFLVPKFGSSNSSILGPTILNLVPPLQIKSHSSSSGTTFLVPVPYFQLRSHISIHSILYKVYSFIDIL